MPFSTTNALHTEEYWTAFFETLKNVMNDLGYSCFRSNAGPGNIVSHIIQSLRDCDLALAVLTDYNPNVWYELGIRHTLRSKTVMLLQDGQVRPFDVSGYGIVSYKDPKDPQKDAFACAIRGKIADYLKELSDSTCDSPVIGAIGGHTVDYYREMIGFYDQLFKKLIEESENPNITENIKSTYSRVLWVDDNPSNNAYLTGLFKDKNVVFDNALTTEQGISFFKKNAYDIIITDMRRGTQSQAGLELLRQLNDLKCETPVVVFTGYVSRDVVKEAMSLGARSVTSSVADVAAILYSITKPD